ncbi:unnamed protein product [Rotaria sp. Silwood2]|nr:unnamed protein product [Rotaria sp. Silwood2]
MGRNPLYAGTVLIELYKITNTRFETETHTSGPSLVSETCMCDSGVKFVNDYTMIYSGAPSDNKTRRAHGVAICLDPIATKVWKDSGFEWEAVSERIIKVRLKCTPIDITVLSVNSPVNPSTKQMASDADKFYHDLQDTIKNVSTNDMLISWVI